MNPAELAAEALGIAPDTIQSTERIKGGLTNESWTVRTHDDTFVVRISTADDVALQIDRASEKNILELVANAGIGAPILVNAPERRLLITRHLRGDTWTAEAARQPNNIRRIARILRELHRLEAPAAHVTDLHESVIGYLRTLEERQQTAKLSARDVQRALDIASRSMRNLEPVLCHNDVHHLNVIDDGERLWVIDWEYAGLGNPLFDLAAVCCYHNFDSTLRQTLAESYWNERKAAQPVALEEICWLFDYIKELWFLVRAQEAL